MKVNKQNVIKTSSLVIILGSILAIYNTGIEPKLANAIYITVSTIITTFIGLWIINGPLKGYHKLSYLLIFVYSILPALFFGSFGILSILS